MVYQKTALCGKQKAVEIPDGASPSEMYEFSRNIDVWAAKHPVNCLGCQGKRAVIEANKKPVIAVFNGEYRFLSNFYMWNVKYDGDTYVSSEHAYQAAKTLDKTQRLDIRRVASPGAAKKLGRLVELRSGWEGMKVAVMEEILRDKFGPGSPLRGKLLSTNDAELVEGNNWHDTFWGVCNGKGENMLGKLLMKLRAEGL